MNYGDSIYEFLSILPFIIQYTYNSDKFFSGFNGCIGRSSIIKPWLARKEVEGMFRGRYDRETTYMVYQSAKIRQQIHQRKGI